VTAGQPIGELETEKATVEFESPAAGTLVEIVHPAGAEVAVGTVIAFVEDGK
jgi:pyruvate/2-oxoglutarate dehydrogenase complex dihydrolipoamide acyltransferase (E2) component